MCVGVSALSNSRFVCLSPSQLNFLQNAPITKKDRYRSPYRVMASNKANSRLMINYCHIQTDSADWFRKVSLFLSLCSRELLSLSLSSSLESEKIENNKAKIPFHKFCRLIRREFLCRRRKVRIAGRGLLANYVTGK